MNCKSCGAEISSDMKFCSACGETNEIAEIVYEVTAEKAEKNNNRTLSIVSMALGIASVVIPVYMALWCGLSLFIPFVYLLATMFVGIVGIVCAVISVKLSKKVVADKNPELIFLKVAKITRLFGLILSIAALSLSAVLLMVLYVGLCCIAFIAVTMAIIGGF